MMQITTPLSLAAVGVYVVVAAGAAAAAVRAGSSRQAGWRPWVWAAVAIMFVGFAVIRAFGLEDAVQADLRSQLLLENRYDARRQIQGPLFAVIFIFSSAIAAGLFYYLVRGKPGRRDTLTLLAAGCTCGMIVLSALRTVSLHSVDALLYGPLKINWIADVGLSVAVLALAARYWTSAR